MPAVRRVLLLPLALSIALVGGAAISQESADAMAYAPEPPRTPGGASAVDAIANATHGMQPAPVPATMSGFIAKIRAPLVPEIPQISEADRSCLAKAIYFEARGESPSGQAAVAQVVLNRTNSYGYPKTVCGVVYQGMQLKTGCQFSFTCDGIPDKIRDKRAWALAKAIARDVLDGKRRTKDLRMATHYHATYVSPYWAPRMKRLTKIGHHVFYNEARRRFSWIGTR